MILLALLKMKIDRNSKKSVHLHPSVSMFGFESAVSGWCGRIALQHCMLDPVPGDAVEQDFTSPGCPGSRLHNSGIIFRMYHIYLLYR
jgi:hypothetical protein